MIYAYDVEPATGELSDGGCWFASGSDEGIPDGLTIDAEGYLWSAEWYGAQIVRYDPDGKVHSRVPMPVTQVSSCGFGGPEYRDLYITTAAGSWASPYAPTGYDYDAGNFGGSLYRLRVDVPGRPESICRIGASR